MQFNALGLLESALGVVGLAVVLALVFVSIAAPLVVTTFLPPF